jgi:hypothetical protein
VGTALIAAQSTSLGGVIGQLLSDFSSSGRNDVLTLLNRYLFSTVDVSRPGSEPLTSNAALVVLNHDVSRAGDALLALVVVVIALRADARRSGFTTISGAEVDAVHPGDVAVIAAGAQTRDGKASGDGHVGIVTAVDQGAGTVILSSENWPEGDTQPRSLTFATSDIEGYVVPPAGASMPASLSPTSPAMSPGAPTT